MTTLTDTLVIAGQTNSVSTKIIVQAINTLARISETNIVQTADGTLTTSVLYDLNGRPYFTTFPDGTIESNHYFGVVGWTNAPFYQRVSAETDTYRGAPSYLRGTKTVTINDTLSGGVIQRSGYLIADGMQLLTSTERVVAVDSEWRPTVQTSFGQTNETVNGCCGVVQTVDAEGIITDYTYDDLKRKIATTRAGVTSSNAYDAASRVVSSYRIPEGGAPVLVSANTYDAAGVHVAATDALGNSTTYSNWTDSVNGWIFRRTTYPNGTWVQEQSYRDGQIYQMSGTAVHGVRYSYSVLADGTFVSRQTKLDDANNLTDEWVETYTDKAGRPYKTVRNGGVTVNQSFYNSLGQMWKQVDADGVTTLFAYNDAGQRETSALDMNRNDQIDYAGNDRISRTQITIATNTGVGVQRTVSSVWPTAGDTNALVVSVTDASPDGLRVWQVANGNTNISSTVIDRFHAAKTLTGTAPDGSQTINVYTNGRLMSAVRKDVAGGQLSMSSYRYDCLGRQSIVTDGRGITTATGYDNADRVVAMTNALGTADQQVTSYLFDNMGRRKVTNLPDGNATYAAYLPTGEVATNWGARSYPVAYTCDYAGRMKTMTTWTNFASSAGAAVTTWNYDPTNGFLVSKKYPLPAGSGQGDGPSYSYTDAGRPRTRTWARNVVTTFGYNAVDDLTSVVYSDATPSVTNTYDRLGRRTVVQTASDTITCSYNAANQVTNETHTAGILGGLGVVTAYDPLLRRASLAVSAGGYLVPAATAFYGYDSASRLQVVSNAAGNAAAYSYLSGADLVSNIVFTTGGATRMTTARAFDNLNRLTSIDSQPSGAGVPHASFNYQYNQADQRTHAVLADGTYWDYSYDSLGQVTNGVRRWATDNTVVAGQDYRYAFDDIGNRTSAGTTAGASVYSANQLNQCTQRTVPGVAEISGSAASAGMVTVNNSPTVRHGEYFYGGISVPNQVSAVWTQLNVVAVLKNAGSNQQDIVTQTTGHKFVAKTPEPFFYDADGSLTNDGRWVYAWDGENRLASMQTDTNRAGASVPVTRVEFAYDGQSRRIGKKVLTGWTNNNYSVTNSTRFLYDGWNPVAEITSSGFTNSYVWGLDLSGTFQNAGGIGGLLFSGFGGTGGVASVFYAYDGNGNVAALVSATDGSIAATYEYSPFGEALRATGPLARTNPVRFSTKVWDDETGLGYWGMRYYHPDQGRWLSRDQKQKIRGDNLYVWLGNSGPHRLDAIGQSWEIIPPVRDSVPDPLPWDDVNHSWVAGLTTADWTGQYVLDECPGSDLFRLREEVEPRLSINWWADKGEYHPVWFPSISVTYEEHERHHISDIEHEWEIAKTSILALKPAECVCKKQAECKLGKALGLWLMQRALAELDGAIYDHISYDDLAYPSRCASAWAMYHLGEDIQRDSCY